MSMLRLPVSALRLVVAAAALACAAPAPHAAAQEDWQEGAPPEWAAILAKAKAEGEVVVGGHPALSQALTAAFERDTGIKLDYFGAPSNELLGRLEQEIVAKRVTMDVVLGGPAGGFHVMGDNDHLAALKPQLLLPQVAEGKYWKHGALKWDDVQGTYMLQTVEWVFGWPLFDSDIVKPDAVTSWKQLLEPQYKGKIAAYDPRFAGAGLAVAAYLAQVFDIDFVTRLFTGQEVTYSRDGRQLVEWAVRGSYPIVLGAVPVDIERYTHQGIENLAVRQLADGPGSVLGGYSVIKEPKAAPHPNAAAVFINWYAGRPGQAIYSKVMLEASLRNDVDDKDLPQYAVPKPGQHYVDQYDPAWYLDRRPKVEQDVTAALGR